MLGIELAIVHSQLPDPNAPVLCQSNFCRSSGDATTQYHTVIACTQMFVPWKRVTARHVRSLWQTQLRAKALFRRRCLKIATLTGPSCLSMEETPGHLRAAKLLNALSGGRTLQQRILRQYQAWSALVFRSSVCAVQISAVKWFDPLGRHRSCRLAIVPIGGIEAVHRSQS